MRFNLFPEQVFMYFIKKRTTQRFAFLFKFIHVAGSLGNWQVLIACCLLTAYWKDQTNLIPVALKKVSHKLINC